MVEWWNGGVVKFSNRRMVEWWRCGVSESSNGGMVHGSCEDVELSSCRMVEL